VKPFLDIKGASGTTYRFRLVGDLAALPAGAGNLLLVRHAAGRSHVVGCASCRSLAHSRDDWVRARGQAGADSLYIRLNVSSAVRKAEHEDLVAACQPLLVAAEVD
jgi:hypothetical protein